ncbi:HipA domain-containing protein [Gluconobacter sp. Gdi]|uniref:HipA domain-containing protein n=1 Tax=Gluconobacter sp. Gdi TaxID=2691888 RepID=UPI00175A3D35|nr:HipA domain-containing protein [Gluconobacter sp. Gdi]GFE97718.1 hypothetical protein DmGdi_27910 [Gluconobacter sp. Gdi]
MYVFSIDEWEDDPEFPVHPVGSQPKRVVIAPSHCGTMGLLPGHTYIFKTAKSVWQRHQLWSEVIAYRVADMVGVDAPRCFPALMRSTGEAGVLMESFLPNSSDAQLTRFVHGADFLARVIVDKKRGRPHLLKLNLWLSRKIGVDPSAVENWWTRVIFFDALIGNSDRHPQNWGFLFKVKPGILSAVHSLLEGSTSAMMGPAFDNGTSLGYETREVDLETKGTDAALDHYIAGGHHHCSWDTPTTKRGEGHLELCRKIIDADIRQKDVLRNMLNFSQGDVEKILDECVDCDLPFLPFTPERAKFVSKLLMRRQMALLDLVK